MTIDYKVQNFDYSFRDGNLDSEAKGKVKSEKHFPYFYENNKKIIFKPISKTKPFATPYFAYSEVVWSHLLNFYFDNRIPTYSLAKCEGYEKKVPKYHDYGTAVRCMTDKREKLVNLYEYFLAHPDENVNIEDYINYCLMFYDYTFFFSTNLFKENNELAKEISKQILYSILRADQNYHYENVSFICDNNNEIIKVAPSIDHEFSTVFMYLDDLKAHDALIDNYIQRIISEDTIISKNIDVISKLYPEIIEEFISNTWHMVNNLADYPLKLENYDYIEAFSSDDFIEATLRYKENKPEQADIIKENIIKKLVLPRNVNNVINNNIKDVGYALINKLKKKIIY